MKLSEQFSVTAFIGQERNLPILNAFTKPIMEVDCFASVRKYDNTEITKPLIGRGPKR